MLALLIRNSKIESLFEQDLVISLKLNICKCEIITIHECPLKTAYNISIKSSVKYLGIHIYKDEIMMEKQNVWDRWNECRGRLDAWTQRDLSIFGRIYLTKMKSLARCIYPAFCLSISNKAINTINQINFNFIWRKHVHYIKRVQLIQDYENGRLQAFDFSCINVLHLMNEDGSLLSFSDFCSKYSLHCEHKQFEHVLKAIPKSFIGLVQNTIVNIPDGSCELPSLLFNGNDLQALLPNYHVERETRGEGIHVQAFIEWTRQRHGQTGRVREITNRYGRERHKRSP
ncbi:LINE-1 retrotransposable element ORF2 protein [Labeo rohita]|uniref:LINE-1 retrotransposable element ORF2 protein n=1 Tax=Labeo rohita TaxID=84645 RepID=A0ABQ8LIZ8_LABRO|nr:LINE-1 retrotransposable element ORF2 protein [Labeo rohita]